jgi:hypothetical protein
MLNVAMRTPSPYPMPGMPAPEETGGLPPGHPVDRETVRDLLKRTAVALKEAGVPFALCGGYAAWVRGAPEPDHDADFLVPAGDAERAAAALTDAGLPVVVPAEDWLVKVVTEGAFIDVLWRTCGAPVENDLIERAEEMPVLSVHMPVLEASDILVTKLMALDEHYCDYGRLLPVARAMREQVDWSDVRRRVADNDFAAVFLILLERLTIIEPEQSAAPPDATV